VGLKLVKPGKSVAHDAAATAVSDHRDYRDQYTVVKASHDKAIPTSARKNANTD